MDSEIIIYLILVGIGLLSSILKGRKEKKAPPPTFDDEAPSDQPNMTFEDLLKEFTESKSPQKSSSTPPPRKPLKKTYEHSYDEKVTESIDVNDDEIDEVYQKSILEAQQRIQDPDYHPIFKKFKNFEEEENNSSPLANDVREELKSPESAAKAILYSEIIRRKY